MFSFEIQFVVLYKAPSMSNIEFTAMLEKDLIPHLNTSKPFIIMGDFNLDVHGNKGLCYKKYVAQFHEEC